MAVQNYRRGMTHGERRQKILTLALLRFQKIPTLSPFGLRPDAVESITRVQLQTAVPPKDSE